MRSPELCEVRVFGGREKGREETLSVVYVLPKPGTHYLLTWSVLSVLPGLVGDSRQLTHSTDPCLELFILL